MNENEGSIKLDQVSDFKRARYNLAIALNHELKDTNDDWGPPSDDILMEEAAKLIHALRKEDKDLQESADLLLALECGGVDNWEWYDESLDGKYFEKDGEFVSFRDLYG